MMQAGKICAVVVTYNRKTVLKKCLDALLKQTRPADLIVVIDNASTDGTDQMLRQAYERNPYIKHINLGTNMGGSGGFHHGVQYAFTEGFDWMWLMDDDCLPAENCLEVLLDNIDDRLQFYSPAVLSLEDRQTFLWGIKGQVSSGNHEVKSIPFNGLFVHRQSVEEVGLPEKNFFIYGDDTEYNLRAKTMGKRTIMVTDSIMYHPHKNMLRGFKIHKMFLNRLWTYYKLRNAIILYKRHGHVARNQVIMLIGALIYYILTLRIDFIRLWFAGLRDGLQGRLYVRPLKS
jgi:rhamnopyranosyl-N-acetylglucosaminyl-diphospho-decaprenol beta-1,3/1,4-galactofuranosyltransferase